MKNYTEYQSFDEYLADYPEYKGYRDMMLRWAKTFGRAPELEKLK